MTFLALASQKAALTLQKSFFDLQMISLQNRILAAQGQIAIVERQCDVNETDPNDDAMYQYWSNQETLLSTEKESIENNKQVIESEISSLTNQINTAIKSSTTLSLSQ